jgi:hypothetical protein
MVPPHFNSASLFSQTAEAKACSDEFNENLACQKLQFCNDRENLQADNRGSEVSAVNEVDRPQLVVEAGCGYPFYGFLH